MKGSASIFQCGQVLPLSPGLLDISLARGVAGAVSGPAFLAQPAAEAARQDADQQSRHPGNDRF
jgi:hypothetical protein